MCSVKYGWAREALSGGQGQVWLSGWLNVDEQQQQHKDRQTDSKVSKVGLAGHEHETRAIGSSMVKATATPFTHGSARETDTMIAGRYTSF